jgi:HD-like signal output (HDOD) protein
MTAGAVWLGILVLVLAVAAGAIAVKKAYRRPGPPVTVPVLEAAPAQPEPPALQEADVPAAPEGALAEATLQPVPEEPSVPGPLAPATIFAMLYELGLGPVAADSTLSEQQWKIITTTTAALRDSATQQRYNPRRPNLLPRLLSAANDETVSRRELASIISRDPSLVGSLLIIANSSYYRVSHKPVESVDRAVILLGTDGIRSLVASALLQPIFRINSGLFPRFADIAWEYTYRCASATVPYSAIVERADPFAAELLSLLIGLAGIVVFRVTLDQCPRESGLVPEASTIAYLLDTQSASVARRIGESWELSAQTLAALDDQEVAQPIYSQPVDPLSEPLLPSPHPQGRALQFGRLVGALAVLRVHDIIDDLTARLSIPVTKMPEQQLERMWTRLTTQPADARGARA